MKNPAKLESKASTWRSRKSKLRTGAISIKPNAQVCNLSSTENSLLSPNRNLSGTSCGFQVNFIDAIRGPLCDEQGTSISLYLTKSEILLDCAHILTCRKPFGKDLEKINDCRHTWKSQLVIL